MFSACSVRCWQDLRLKGSKLGNKFLRHSLGTITVRLKIRQHTALDEITSLLTDLQSVEQRRFSGSVEAEDEDPHFAAAQEAFEVAEEATHGEKSQKLTKSGCLFLY